MGAAAGHMSDNAVLDIAAGAGIVVVVADIQAVECIGAAAAGKTGVVADMQDVEGIAAAAGRMGVVADM